MNRLLSFAAGGLALVAIAVAFGGGVYGALLLKGQEALPAAAAVAEFRVTLDPSLITGKAAVLYSLDGRVIYQKDANTAYPLASLNKLMTIQTVLAHVAQDSLVQISGADLTPEGDWGFYPGQTVPLGDLIRFGLVASSNDAIEAAAATLGPDSIARMNEEAQRLGLTKLHFNNASGVDVDQTIAGGYGSAYDVARLGARFYRDHPELFELTTRADVRIEDGEKGMTASATAVPLFDIPGFVAAKTGFTDLAGGNLVAVFDLEPGETVVAVVLGSTREGRFEDIRTIINTARTEMSNPKLQITNI